MPEPSKEPCKKQACDIQACLTKNNFNSQSWREEKGVKIISNLFSLAIICWSSLSFNLMVTGIKMIVRKFPSDYSINIRIRVCLLNRLSRLGSGALGWTDSKGTALDHPPMYAYQYKNWCVRVIELLQACCEECKYKSTHCASLSGLLKQIRK